MGALARVLVDEHQAAANRQLRFRFLLAALVVACYFVMCCRSEGLNLDDTLWFAITLSTGQGYGDVHLDTPTGRWSVVAFTAVFNIAFAWAITVTAKWIQSADDIVMRRFSRFLPRGL